MKKFGLSILFFSVIFGVVITFIGLRLRRGKVFNSEFDKTRWNEFYSETNTIDYLFVGSSHCYNSFIPQVVDSIKSTNSFNLGSASQSPITSYYVIEEAIRSKNIKTIIFEIFPNILLEGDNFNNAIINVDYIKSKDVRIKLLLTSDNYSDILEILIPAYMFNNYLTTLFKSNPVEEVLTIHNNVISYYYGKGYLKSIKTSEYRYPKKIESLNLNNNLFSKKKIKSIGRIINLCRTNKVLLTIVTAPQNPLYYKKIEGYDIFHNKIDSISKVNGINYIDANLLIEEIGVTEKDYYDSGHMLYSGAVKFSTWFANRLKYNKEINSSFVLDVETNN